VVSGTAALVAAPSSGTPAALQAEQLHVKVVSVSMQSERAASPDPCMQGCMHMCPVHAGTACDSCAAFYALAVATTAIAGLADYCCMLPKEQHDVTSDAAASVAMSWWHW
jgi:hypothetical protein